MIAYLIASLLLHSFLTLVVVFDPEETPRMRAANVVLFGAMALWAVVLLLR